MANSEEAALDRPTIGVTTTDEEVSRAVWDSMQPGGAKPEILVSGGSLDLRPGDLYRSTGVVNPEVLAGAERFSAGLLNASSDAEAARLFEEYIGANKNQSAAELFGGVEQAMRGRDSQYAVHLARSGNDTDLILMRHPEVSRQTILETEFFKAGEDPEADFDPDYGELDEMAARFAAQRPDQLTPQEFEKSLQDIFDQMKQVGAGPRDVKSVLNKAFEDAGLPLDIYINRHGEVELSEVHKSKEIARVKVATP